MLKEFAFFTFAKADGKKEKFLEPVDYFLDYKDTALTLHFTLPLKKPSKRSSWRLKCSIRSYFIDFHFADKTRSSWSGRPPPAR